MDSSAWFENEKVIFECEKLLRKMEEYRSVSKTSRVTIDKYILVLHYHGLMIFSYKKKRFQKMRRRTRIDILRYKVYPDPLFREEMLELFDFFIAELDEYIAMINDNKQLNREYVDARVGLSY
jgi:hypothetical protein